MLRLELPPRKRTPSLRGEGGQRKKGRVEWLLQGDVIENISFEGPSLTIKTHHNVGTLLKDMKLKLIEPLCELFKGVYYLLPSFFRTKFAPSTALSAPFVQQLPFFGPDLAIRVLGPVTREQAEILQHAVGYSTGARSFEFMIEVVHHSDHK